MPLVIDLTREEEARLNRAARERGVAPKELVRQLVQEGLPATVDEVPPIDEENARAIALLESWRERDATTDPEELEKAEEEVQELLRNLNQNRIDAGERPLFP